MWRLLYWTAEIMLWLALAVGLWLAWEKMGETVEHRWERAVPAK